MRLPFTVKIVLILSGDFDSSAVFARELLLLFADAVTGELRTLLFF